MTTITIKLDIQLEKFEFESIDELIESYFSQRGKIIINEIEKESLSKSIQDDLSESISLGDTELFDFK